MSAPLIFYRHVELGMGLRTEPRLSSRALPWLLFTEPAASYIPSMIWWRNSGNTLDEDLVAYYVVWVLLLRCVPGHFAFLSNTVLSARIHLD